MTSAAIFEADPEGFRAQNADRPPEHLVRELIQNALDEDGVTALTIDVAYHGPRRGTTVTVTDDAPAGVKDAKMLFTIWLSDKQDSPTKRGRMGRGLKELVSVADLTVIRSVSCDALVFKRHKGGRWERRTDTKMSRPERGTEVTAFCGAWGEKAAKRIAAFVRRIRAPQHIALSMGPFGRVAAFQATERYKMALPTTMFEVVDGVRAERERVRDCDVECFVPPADEKAYVYEMGIPVEECDSPVSIDVGQRVILRERRDTLTESYKRKLFAKVLSARLEAGLVADEQLRDNTAISAAASSLDLSYDAKRRIVKVWTEGKPFAADSKMRALATGHHVEVVNLRSLPEAVRDIVRVYGDNVKDVMEKRRAELCPAVADLSPEQERLRVFFEWIAKGVGRECTVSIRNGNPGTRGDFERTSRVLSIYADVVGKAFFKDPAAPGPLALLIHELSHWTPKADEHGSDFAHDNDAVGGLVASFLLKNAAQAQLVLRTD